MASYAERVKNEIARWTADGLIDAGTAERLALDIEAHARSRISFPAIFAMMGGILVGAAVLLLVAANWEAIPRLVRVGLLMALILVGYVGGSVLKLRDHAVFGEAAWLVAAIAFGGSIALVAQMYHMSGDEADAILTWLAGTVLAAILLRCSPLTIGAVLLSGVWLLMTADLFVRTDAIPYLWLLLAAGLWAVSLWTGSHPARHLLSLVLVFFSWIAYFNTETALVPMLVLVLAGTLFAAERTSLPMAARLGLGGKPSLHGLVHFLSGMAMLHVLYADDGLHFLLVLLTLAGVAGALLVAGRDNRGLRWLAYAAFAVELCYVYLVLLGTMLGTAGVLLLAGLGLALLAWVVRRLERRLAGPRDGGEVAA
ncbi:DUF2157 domain-containing protein [Chelativorans sp. ZYF759]|uniref:DUF2157 domain-containing protein n=1 Tax=Chelativorans sp. ZYF759 TaxID=2692213 RepID=UPI00145EA508|nr:DUF2157 domain-containing protein [Chelativorans sp. ZYF759]NMG39994.1 DUF2157 domain-containing protein [Chelativorans sp. ZYF759]